MELIKQILSRNNLHQAYKQVKQNKGSAGVDGLSVDKLQSHLREHWPVIRQRVSEGTYLPQPILGVHIPKGNGKERLLGIPTVTDRLLQQAVSQVLSPVFEKEFRQHNYGFRPGRNAHQAIRQAQQNINEGYQYIIDIDLQNFFDEVEHDLLLQLIYRKVQCDKSLRLIRIWLKAPILLNGQLARRKKGVPQGSPLSPLLSNIVLNELDKELEKRGHHYVRYADDFSIYVKSKQAARRVGNSISLFLKGKLRLPINREKSGIRRPVTLKLLGYGFVPTYRKGENGKYQLVADSKAWKRFRQAIKQITCKTTPMSFDERVKRLNEALRGWVNYFRLASISAKLKKMDEWIRNRLRYCIWHYWKRPERKRKNLTRLGVDPEQAYAWSRTRKGGWAVAQSPMLRTTITLERLRRRGYISLLTHYKSISDA